MKTVNIILPIFLLLFASCAKDDVISLGNIGEEIEILVLSPTDVMISHDSDRGVNVTDLPLEYGKSYNLFTTNEEEGLHELLSSVTEWTDSNGKVWTIYHYLNADTQYTVTTFAPFDTKDESPFLYYADTGITFFTCKENQSPFIRDEDVRCELYRRKGYYYDMDLPFYDPDDINYEEVTYFTVSYPDRIELTNGDFITVEYPDLYASFSSDMSEPIAMRETENYIEGNIKKILYRCPVLDNGKYYFELKCELNIHSSNQDYGQDIGDYIFRLNSLDLWGEE